MPTNGDVERDLTLAAAYRSEADEWWAEARLRRERADREARAMEDRAARLLMLAASIEKRYQGVAA